MRNILKDMLKDIKSIEREIIDLNIELSRTPEGDKKTRMSLRSLLSKYRNDKIKLWDTYLSADQNFKYKNKLLEKQRERLEVEIARLAGGSDDTIEYDEFMSFVREGFDKVKKDMEGDISDED